MKRERPGKVSITALTYEAGLSPFAQRSDDSRGRARDEESCGIRLPYQRDRDRIVHSKAFRRLKHKTQVFISPEGDHYRTRLTHTLEVSGVARAVTRALHLNEDLAEAVALGHDLGHTPFGHAGEGALDAVLRDLGYAGFRHNEQSLRVVDVLENEGRGLNLTWEVRDGIARHTGESRPFTLEGRVVRLCDRVAYINHDIDDALRAGLILRSDLPHEAVALLGSTGSERIDALAHDMVDASEAAGDIVQSPEVGAAMDDLRTFLFRTVYDTSVKESGGEAIRDLLARLFRHFMDHPEELPSALLRAGALADGAAPDPACCEPAELVRAVTDHVAGMTDRYAEQVYSDVFLPRSWGR